MPYQCSLSPWAPSSFLCLRLCTYHKFYIFSLLKVGSYSEFYVLKGKFRECIIFFLWKDPSLAFRPRSFQNFCLTIDINEYNFILSVEEWPLTLSVICSPEEINAMILKWQGHGENLRKEKKINLDIISNYYLAQLSLQGWMNLSHLVLNSILFSCHHLCSSHWWAR